MVDASRRPSPLVRATVVGTVLQLAMVITGHYVAPVKQWFAIGGTGISAVAGVLAALWARPDSAGGTARAGAIAGGVCALIGIAVSCLLKDVELYILALGTSFSAIGGIIGAYVGRALNKSGA